MRTIPLTPIFAALLILLSVLGNQILNRGWGDPLLPGWLYGSALGRSCCNQAVGVMFAMGRGDKVKHQASANSGKL